MGREEVVHDDEMDFFAARELDAMETVEATDEGMWVIHDVLVVLFEDLAEELVLGVGDGLDDEAVVSGKVEEGARLAGRSQLAEDVLGRQGQKVVGWIQVEPRPQLSKHPRCVILEFEVVFGRRGQFVADAGRDGRVSMKATTDAAKISTRSHVEGEFVFGCVVCICQRTFELGFATGHLEESRRVSALVGVSPSLAIIGRPSAHAYPDAGEHVVHEYVIDMVLPNEITDEDPLLLWQIAFGRGGSIDALLRASDRRRDSLILLKILVWREELSVWCRGR